MSELATKTNSGNLEIRTMDDLMNISEMLAASGFFSDAKGQAQAAVKVLAGAELGIGPFAAMTGIHIVEGKPMVGGNLMAAAVKRSGRYDYQVTEMTDKRVAITFYRDGEELGESAFSMEDARTASVPMKTYKGHDTNWVKFPRNMLFNRAISNGVKWFCPDVFTTTFYVEGEIPEGGQDPYEEGEEHTPAPARGAAGLAARLTGQKATQEPTDEEVQDAEFTPAPAEPDAEPVLRLTRPQATAIAIALQTAKFKDTAEGKAEGRKFVAFLAGIEGELESSKDLTREQAGAVLERLGDGENGSFKTDQKKVDSALDEWRVALDLQSNPLPDFDPNEKPSKKSGMKPIADDEPPAQLDEPTQERMPF